MDLRPLVLGSTQVLVQPAGTHEDLVLARRRAELVTTRQIAAGIRTIRVGEFALYGRSGAEDSSGPSLGIRVRLYGSIKYAKRI